MLGWLKSAVTFAAKMYSWVKKTDKPSIVDALPFAVGQLLPMVQRAIEYQGFDTQEKFDAWLMTLDQATGVESGAVDLIGGLPPDKEEQFFDHLVEAARIYGYHLMGLEGYHEAGAEIQPASVVIPLYPEKAGVTEPALEWDVTIRCAIAMIPDQLMAAWRVRLPVMLIDIDFNASDENKTVFVVHALISASVNAKAASMASDLLKRHFDSVEILEMTAERAGK